MKLFESKHLIALLGVMALVISGCASDGSELAEQQIKALQTIASEPDKKLFSQALMAQDKGQIESAIKLWKEYLAKHPESYEAHNNLGSLYYNQDMLTQALQEFETAYRLQPNDEKTRKNLARALRFKASMLHESREYFKTLEVLARLEDIVEPEEKQAVLFNQEQVEDQIYLQVIKANNSAAYQDFINRFPDGFNAVRAHEYLEKHPNRVSKRTSQNKSWISSGKAVSNPSGDPGNTKSWVSSEQPPDYSTSSPTAIYTPPPPGTKKRKGGDFFGVDADAVEAITDDNVTTSLEIDRAKAIPFEDFEKPERSSGEQAPAKDRAEGSDIRRAGESDPVHGEPDAVAADLDTQPDLEPVQVAALPVVTDATSSSDALAGDIQMQPAEQEPVIAAPAAVEETEKQVSPEEVKQEEVKQEEPQVEPQTEMAQSKNAEPEPVESENERIARIVQEEIALAESAQPEPVMPEPAQEMQVEKESPQEESMEVARFDPEEQDVKQETAPAESAVAEGTPNLSDFDEKKEISQETVSETLAALIPSPPATEAMKAPAETTDSSNNMVVIQMRDGGTLNVRANPSTQGKILGYLENGDTMPLVSESGNWYQIEIEEGLSGWVSKKYSTLRNVTEASLPAPDEDMTSELSPLQPDQTQSSGAMVLVTVGEDATLNVRSLPSSDGAVVDMLFGGDRLPLVKEEGEWYQVSFEDETTGWISKKYSVLEGGDPKAISPAPAPAPKEKVDYWSNTVKKETREMVTTVVVIKVPEGSTLNVRSTPSSKGRVLGILKRGEMRPLLEETREWYQVDLQNGQSGWVSQKFSGKMQVDPSFVQNP
jgi:uncharacterized protein YgiM (DUF1202 family)